MQGTYPTAFILMQVTLYRVLQKQWKLYFNVLDNLNGDIHVFICGPQANLDIYQSEKCFATQVLGPNRKFENYKICHSRRFLSLHYPEQPLHPQ
jgi:hypothetical protein